MSAFSEKPPFPVKGQNRFLRVRELSNDCFKNLLNYANKRAIISSEVKRHCLRKIWNTQRIPSICLR